MRRGTLNLLSSIIFLVIVIVAFYIVWSSVKGQNQETSPTIYNTVSISSVKTQARDLVSSLENNSNLPLTAPTTKMGKENPFSDIETE